MTAERVPSDPMAAEEMRGRLGLETARVPQSDRHGLLWLARGQLYVDSGTLRFRCAGFVDLDPGDYAIPFQLLTCLVLQPGTSLTHDVLRLCASHGTGIVAVGEEEHAFLPARPRDQTSRRGRGVTRSRGPIRTSGCGSLVACTPGAWARSFRAPRSRCCAGWRARG
jgi:hypothetical protein